MLHNQQKNIDFVRLYLVDFINSKTDEERLSNLKNIVYKGRESFTNYIRDSVVGKLIIVLDNKYAEHLQSIILKMLRIALIDGEFKKLYPEVDNDSIEETELEKYICELFETEKPKDFIRWRGKKETYVVPDSFTSINIQKEFEYEIIKKLFDLFESDETAEAIGYQYFSFCPKCGKFFYKKRKDQVYCSERCRNNDKSMRYREKKKG